MSLGQCRIHDGDAKPTVFRKGVSEFDRYPLVGPLRRLASPSWVMASIVVVYPQVQCELIGNIKIAQKSVSGVGPGAEIAQYKWNTR
jgi:hypothetical protein